MIMKDHELVILYSVEMCRNLDDWQHKKRNIANIHARHGKQFIVEANSRHIGEHSGNAGWH